jgi:hypothetical protein
MADPTNDRLFGLGPLIRYGQRRGWHPLEVLAPTCNPTGAPQLQAEDMMRIAGTIHRAVTRRTALGLSIGGMAMMACGRDLLAAGWTERVELETVFAENGVAGTFVLLDVEADRFTLINAERAKMRLVPASTFKIANTIIASKPMW